MSHDELSLQGVHGVRGCLGVGGDDTPLRAENDFYATEPKAAELLLGLERLSHNIWECACGEGHLARVFEAHGFNVKATDLIDRGYGQGGVNFLEQSGIYDGDIITNPPFSLAEKFIRHALALVPDSNKVIMFLKVQFLEGKVRRGLYVNTPPRRVWVSSSRLKCGRNGDFKNTGNMVSYAWFVWEKGYQGVTELRWFN